MHLKVVKMVNFMLYMYSTTIQKQGHRLGNWCDWEINPGLPLPPSNFVTLDKLLLFIELLMLRVLISEIGIRIVPASQHYGDTVSERV